MNKRPSERAIELFAANYSCAQSVFAAAGAGEMSEEQRLAVSSAFGGGVASQGEVCGALTGALMALGERNGAMLFADPDQGRKTVNRQAQELIAEFRAAHGSILCHDLTGCRLNTEEGKKAYLERYLRRQLCAGLVAFAADWVAQTVTMS
jgi:C_GCAxxG_C_C family probable redox protein